MEQGTTWLTQVQTKFEAAKETIYHSDYKFYQIDKFSKASEKVQLLSKECSECSNLKSEIEEVANHIDEYFKGNSSKRRDYEYRFDLVINHLKKTHGYYPREYFVSLYSVYGLFIGGLIGYLAVIIFSPANWIYGLSLGAVLAMFYTRYLGKKKDKDIKAKDLIL
jgi:hypothetical protein